MRRAVVVLGVLAIATIAPTRAGAQTLWIVAGGGSTSLLGDCTGCESETYIHSGSLMGTVGRSINRRADLGLEVSWVPGSTPTGEALRTTFALASLQFRPWERRGFFLRAGIGMAFVKNWVSTLDVEQPTQVFLEKAFGLALGAGWEWRVGPRWGAQVYGAQHVAALGDMTVSTGTLENVMGNYWTVGAAVVIR